MENLYNRIYCKYLALSYAEYISPMIMVFILPNFPSLIQAKISIVKKYVPIEKRIFTLY